MNDKELFQYYMSQTRLGTVVKVLVAVIVLWCALVYIFA
jgi:hypothetical protein